MMKVTFICTLLMCIFLGGQAANVTWSPNGPPASPYVVVAGAYWLPGTIYGVPSFTSAVSVSFANSNFGFSAPLIAYSGYTSVSTNIGCAGSVAAGVYQLQTVLNDTSYPQPDALSVQVTTTAITLPAAPAKMDVIYNAGTPAASNPVNFDLSAYPPWSDITITPTFANGDNNFTVAPPSWKFTVNSTTVNFVFHTNDGVVLGSNTKVTWVISGTNAATYTISGVTTVNAVQATSSNTPTQTVNASQPIYSAVATSGVTVYAGVYSLPVTVSTPSINFVEVDTITQNNSLNFGFLNSPFQTSTSAMQVSNLLGAVAWATAGSYSLNFAISGKSYMSPIPSGPVSVTVSTTPIEIKFAPKVDVSWTAGQASSSNPISFDLSATVPWTDITITAHIPDTDGNFTVSPASITFGPNNKVGSFVFTTTTTSILNCQTLVTYSISGTNSASFWISNSNQVVNTVTGSNSDNTVGGSSGTGSGSTTTNTTTTNTTGTNTTTTNTTNTTTTNSTTVGTGSNSATQTVDGTSTMYCVWSQATTWNTPISVVVGTYSAKLTINTPTYNFAEVVTIGLNDTNFGFNPTPFVTSTSSQSASAYLGCAETLALGTYVVNTTVSGSKYFSAGVVFVSVVNTPNVINIGNAVVPVQWEEGIAGGSSNPIVIDLSSMAPWTNVTISVGLPVDSTSFTCSPASITFSASQPKGTFMCQTTTSTQMNDTAALTWMINGTDAAAYSVSGSMSVVAVSANGTNTTSTNTTNTTNVTVGTGGNGGSQVNTTNVIVRSTTAAALAMSVIVAFVASALIIA